MSHNDTHQHPPAIGDTQPGTKHRYEIREADLPLHCPTNGMSLWNFHPRVYLPIEHTGKAKCPYCGAEYVLKG